MSEKIYSGTLVLTNKAFPENVSYKLKGIFYDICKRFLSEDTFAGDNGDNILKVSGNEFTGYFDYRDLSVMIGCGKKKAKSILETFVYYGLFSETYLGTYTVNKEYAYFSKPVRIVTIK